MHLLDSSRRHLARLIGFLHSHSVWLIVSASQAASQHSCPSTVCHRDCKRIHLEYSPDVIRLKLAPQFYHRVDERYVDCADIKTDLRRSAVHATSVSLHGRNRRHHHLVPTHEHRCKVP
ncbi:hypothetical protein OBBRIDRAFT_39434 [Obba rivulosa]|uniref:Uncharacterized protein n=1 Tax=Obba rivulosa TaxID=1052685 RepID=A0A8E2DJK9_9APHY|nr:hypothetical protein OBBRIDRAFT_39434 [Obba rivulosa]